MNIVHNTLIVLSGMGLTVVLEGLAYGVYKYRHNQKYVTVKWDSQTKYFRRKIVDFTRRELQYHLKTEVYEKIEKKFGIDHSTAIRYTIAVGSMNRKDMQRATKKLNNSSKSKLNDANGKFIETMPYIKKDHPRPTDW